jgi:glucokinase
VILAGDVGGTKTNVALFDPDLTLLDERQFRSADHGGLEEIAVAFLAETGARPAAATFGIAGPVVAGRCQTTNLPWTVEAASLAREIGVPSVGLINDLEANAHGIAALSASDFLVLNEGAPGATGNAALIAAGTGLGEAGLYWDGSRHHPFASEGGHASFSPVGKLQLELLEYLDQELDHVSWERLLSGPGLVSVFRFLRDTGRGEEPAWLAESMRSGDAAAAISKAALDATSPLCMKAVDLFVELYGAEAGNLGLKLLATGGVYIGGGIAPRIASRLVDGRFIAAFTAKGRMRDVVASMPVRVILNDRAALLGAARHAAFGR